MSRSVIGVSVDLHKKLRGVSAEAGVPLTIVLEYWVDNCSDADWGIIKNNYEATKPTWKNIRKFVNEYLKKNPDATDTEIVNHTGYSLAQVETITHTAHKRSINGYRSGIEPELLAKKADVSVKFAIRIIDCIEGRHKIPKDEQYLFKQY